MQRIFKAFFYSINGLKLACRDEAAFRQLLLLLVVATVLALALPLTPLAKVLLIGLHGLTLVVELLNSGIEAVVDRIGAERHELSGKAKDCGSAAQLVMLTIVAGFWVVALLGII